MSLLSIRDLSKTFPGQRALEKVALDVHAGEIHALVGQNGSGKSTLIKILARYHDADPGASIAVVGRELGTHSQHDLPMRFIHQDLGLVATLNTVENLALGQGFVCSRLGRIRWKRQVELARHSIVQLGMFFDVTLPIGALSPSERTGVALARAMAGMPSPGILVLDEPTAALPITEVERLFEMLRAIAATGSGVLFVSHRVDEVLNISDRITVLRDGKVRAVVSTRSVDHDAIVELITGSKVNLLFPALPIPGDDVVLRVDGLRSERVCNVSFAVRRSEILGVAGITGSGREDLASLVFGASAISAGAVELRGRKIRSNEPRAAIRSGMAFVPADRATHGVIPGHSLRENLTISRLRPFVRCGVLVRNSERLEVQRWIQRVSIAPPTAESPLGRFSGGNQQKVMLARNLRLFPEVLVLDEPTQGVDVGAKAAIYGEIAKVAESGTAVLVCSSDSEELAHLCDRVVVLRDGCIATELSRPELSPQAITAATLQRGAPSLNGCSG